MSDEAEFPRDHNASSMKIAALEDVRRELNLFAERRDGIVKSAAGFVQIRDRHDAGKVTDLVGIAQQVWDLVEAERKRVAGPHYEAFRRVNDYVAQFWEPAREQIERLTNLLDAFEEERGEQIKRQREEQQRHEERLRGKTAPSLVTDEPDAFPAPAARQTKPQNIRGDYGFTARRRAINEITLEDWRLLPDFIFQSQPVIDAIIATAKPLVDKNVVIPGLKVKKSRKTSVGR